MFAKTASGRPDGPSKKRKSRFQTKNDLRFFGRCGGGRENFRGMASAGAFASWRPGVPGLGNRIRGSQSPELTIALHQIILTGLKIAEE